MKLKLQNVDVLEQVGGQSDAVGDITICVSRPGGAGLHKETHQREAQDQA